MTPERSSTTSAARSCSGDMYLSVPSRLPAAVSATSPCTLETPKSITFRIAVPPTSSKSSSRVTSYFPERRKRLSTGEQCLSDVRLHRYARALSVHDAIRRDPIVERALR
jgi:hypothetical protein